MSIEERDRYRGLLEADGRYSRPHIRDEVVIRTACGCEKIIATFDGSRTYQAQIEIDPPRTLDKLDWNASGTYVVRRFAWQGQMDAHGRRVFEELVVRQEPWEQRYKDLYHDVYGMDTGL